MVSLEELCCVCMQKSEPLNSINNKNAKDITYMQELSSVVPCQEWFTDFKICQNCATDLNQAYNFLQKCIQSQELREELLKDRVKSEPRLELNPDTIIKVEKSEVSIIFTCDLCGKCFKSKNTIKNHIDKIHNKDNNDKIDKDENSDNDAGGFDSDTSNDRPLADLLNDLSENVIDKDISEKKSDEEKEENIIIKIKQTRKKRHKEAEEKSAEVRKPRGRKRKERLKEEKNKTPVKKKKPKLPVTCEYCQRVFNHRQTYELHVRTNHTFEKPYECDLCPAKFVRNQNLMIHKRTHTNERPYICDTCGKDFASSGNLSHHSKIHLNKREYQCDLCDKSFNKSGNLSAHKIVVHSDPADWKFICQVCGKKFPVKGGLVLHMQRHVGKKEDVCHVCKKEFLNKYELKRHMLSHSSDLIFECTVCKEKTFKTGYGLRRHMAFTHNIGKVKYWKAEKKYACHICPKLFTNNFKLKKHLTTHTSDKTFGNLNPPIVQQSTHGGFVQSNFT